MRLLLTGAEGMLATALQKSLPAHWTLFPFGKAQLNITDPKQVREAVHLCKPDVIINAAAFTRVDDCETRPEQAFLLNGSAVGFLAETAQSIGALFVHFSTDYLFDGKSQTPYTEQTLPCPLSVYGKSKLEGETRVLASGCRTLLIRTQWLYGEGGVHFVRTIRNMAESRPEIRVVDDQIGSPTYVADLAHATFNLLEKGAEGIFHVTNSGTTSWFGFARKIVEFSGLKTEVQPCTTEEFPRPAPRPRYSVLSCEKMEQFLGYRLRSWEEALKDYLAREKTAL
jgi:dTDP-4-dehydrorhamnose reductase